jgi:hypothetical protein
MKFLLIVLSFAVSFTITTAVQADTAAMSILVGDGLVEATLETSEFGNSGINARIGFLSKEEGEDETVINSLSANYRIGGETFYASLNGGLSIEGDAELYGRDEYGLLYGGSIGYSFNKHFSIAIMAQEYADIATVTAGARMKF